jgi:hypothetical protein
MTYEDPVDALLRQAFCGHAWLIERLLRRLAAAGDPRQERLFSARDFAEDCAAMAAHRMGAPDPFLPMPPAPDPDPVGWFDVGFSALLLELVTLHLRPPGETDGQADTSYAAGAESFRLLRRFAFEQSAAEDQGPIDARIRAFIIPAAAVWGEAFLREAADALDKRLPRRAVLADAVKALAAAGLPDDPWRYLEPQLDRYGKAFGIGFFKKKAIKAGLWLAK